MYIPGKWLISHQRFHSWWGHWAVLELPQLSPHLPHTPLSALYGYHHHTHIYCNQEFYSMYFYTHSLFFNFRSKWLYIQQISNKYCNYVNGKYALSCSTISDSNNHNWLSQVFVTNIGRFSYLHYPNIFKLWSTP